MFGFLIGAAALGYASYAAYSPRSQLYGRTYLGAGRGSRQLALTYDDGPNDPHTLRLLEVLARHEVRATFFMIGRFVAEKPEIAREVARAGHVIGNHTFNHPNLIFCSPSRVRNELEQCGKVLADTVGEHSRLWRPPFGARLPHVLGVSRKLGLEPVMWTVSSNDWRIYTADAIERRVAERIRGGDVILMHDGGHVRMGADRARTVEATDRLIRRCKDQGYQFVSVTEMMRSAVGLRSSVVG
ncbi:MAG TPA: polysaccharide deacetylase family protein [Terriglobales bacterium]|jgi:peptidoglycan/xylan/chitin deacetylase (PgdA/CDA1 family)|nr:polysaccharide deacetylase family protein [Terriglobales bacterium]